MSSFVSDFKLVRGVLKRFPRKRLGFLIGAITFVSALEAVGVVSLVPLIELAQKSQNHSSRGAIVWFAIGLLAFFVFKAVAGIGVGYLQEKFWRTADAQLGHRLLEHYLHLPYQRFLSTNTAHFYRTVTFDTSQVTGGVNQVLSILSECMLMAFILAGLFYLDPLTTVIVALGIPLVFGSIYALIQKRVNALAVTTQDLSGRQILTANQALQGVKEIQVFGGESFFAGAYLKNALNSANVLTRLQVLSLIPKSFLETVLMVVGICAILVVVFWSQDPARALSLVALYAMAGYKVMPSLNRLVAAALNLKRMIPSMRVLEAEFGEMRGSGAASSVAPVLEFKHRLEIQDLGFAYENSSEVLRGISWTLQRGSFVGIVGTSGAGKSTLVDIVLGLLQPKSGQILLDGKKLNDTARPEYRGLFGYVPQTLFLTDDTLARNIAFGVSDESIDLERVRQAAEGAQLMPWVSTLEKGFDTVVGERGARVSGGQKQRIGIARALYRDPEILILDEATSALDGITESEFLETLRALRGKRTIVLVAHRLSTLTDCDEIVFLQNGKISAQGVHSALYASSPDYQTLCHSLNLHG